MNAATGSPKNITPKRETISSAPRSRSGSSAASPRRQVVFGELAQPFRREGEHGSREIECDDASGRTNGACQFDGCGAASATDIDHRRSGARRGKFEQRSDHGSERAIETILVAGPVFAVDSIPAFALVFVESLCGCHRERSHSRTLAARAYAGTGCETIAPSGGSETNADLVDVDDRGAGAAGV